MRSQYRYGTPIILDGTPNVYLIGLVQNPDISVEASTEYQRGTKLYRCRGTCRGNFTQKLYNFVEFSGRRVQTESPAQTHPNVKAVVRLRRGCCVPN